ncbi:MAG: hypothetical protein ACQERF_07115 [Actinomycetota bacterium]
MTDLDPSAAHLHHLLLTDEEISRADLDSLARSRFPLAGEISLDAITLGPGLFLTGPWTVGERIRGQLDAPPWATSAYLALCPQERAGELPPELLGSDPILDAYPAGIPDGRELEVLRFLHAAARRLAGALHLAGTAVLLQPDPESAVDLAVYSPVTLAVEAVVEAIGRDDVSLDGRTRRTWSISMPAAPALRLPTTRRGRRASITSAVESAGILQVISDRHPMPPLAIAAFGWAAPGARGYEIRWHPPVEYRAGRLSLAQRRVRAEVIAEVERIAREVQRLAGGVVVDDDAFLVALGAD